MLTVSDIYSYFIDLKTVYIRRTSYHYHRIKTKNKRTAYKEI